MSTKGGPQNELVEGSTDTLTSNDRFPALTLDIEAYKKFVDDAELSEAQQRELLSAMWEIIVACVDLRIRLRPAQPVTNIASVLEQDSPSVIGSEGISENKPIEVADRFSERAERIDS